jgi:hypothetical protein
MRIGRPITAITLTVAKQTQLRSLARSRDSTLAARTSLVKLSRSSVEDYQPVTPLPARCLPVAKIVKNAYEGILGGSKA